MRRASASAAPTAFWGLWALLRVIVDNDGQVAEFLRTAPAGLVTANRAVSPTKPCYCPQDRLEPVLLEHLLAHGGRVRFGTELAGFTTGGTSVNGELRDRASGRAVRVRPGT
ncbi:MAG: FAD-dependent monooxygenase [Pseudonocardiaceae bacterium]